MRCMLEHENVAEGGERVDLGSRTTRSRAAEHTPMALCFGSATPRATMLMASVIGIAVATAALSAAAQTAKDVKGPTPLVAIQNEPPAKLIVDPPIPEQLALGRVFIQYRTENLRILPVFGSAALAVSPRIGHLHYYVDDQSWATVDTSGETLALVGLPPGPHKVRLELADSTHKAIPGASELVEFIVPPSNQPHN